MMRPARNDRTTARRTTLAVACWIALVAALPPGPALADDLAGLDLATLAHRPLSEALDRLRDAGLDLVYTTRLVRPEMRVGDAPTAREPERLLAQLLRPHGLDVRPGTGGRWVVVTATATPADVRLVGRVISLSDGRPLPGATIVAAGGSPAATTGLDGRFELDGLPPGPIDLEVRHPEHVVAELELDLPLAEDPPLEVALVPGAFDGEPVLVQPSRVRALEERAASAVDLDRDAILSLPHLGDDVFRALELLPGIASNDVSAEFHIRGGRRDEVLVLLDGQELFEAFHLPDYDNALSLVTATGLSSVSLTTGAFPAAHGDRMGGVLEMETLEPPGQPTHRLAATLFDLEASTSRRFAAGRGSAYVSARLGTARLAGELLRDERPEYDDLFAKLEVPLGPRQTLGARLLLSSDRLTLSEPRPTEGKRIETDYDVLYVWATHRWIVNDSLLVETVASLSSTDRDRADDEVDDEKALRLVDRRALDVRGLRQSWHLRTRDGGRWLAGLEWRRFESRLDYERERTFLTPVADLRSDASEGLFTFRARPVDEHRSVHASRLARFGRITVEAGARWDEHSLRDESSVDPRLNLSLAAGRLGTFRLGWGRFHQSQRTYELAVEDGETGFSPIERSDHRVLGWERSFAPDRRRGLDVLRVELFRRSVRDPRPRYENLLEPFDPFPEGESDRVRFAPEASRSEGLELVARGHLGERVSGWLGYTTSRSEDRIDGRERPRLIDQSHAVTLDLDWQLGRSWTLNLAWLFHTGRPTTPVSLVFAEVPDAPAGDAEAPGGEDGEAIDGETEVSVVAGPLNSRRLADYHRLDLRLSRRAALRRGELTLYLDVQNLYDRANQAGYSVEYDDEEMALRFEVEEWPGFLASAGVAWRF